MGFGGINKAFQLRIGVYSLNPVLRDCFNYHNLVVMDKSFTTSQQCLQARLDQCGNVSRVFPSGFLFNVFNLFFSKSFQYLPFNYLPFNYLPYNYQRVLGYLLAIQLSVYIQDPNKILPLFALYKLVIDTKSISTLFQFPEPVSQASLAQALLLQIFPR